MLRVRKLLLHLESKELKISPRACSYKISSDTKIFSFDLIIKIGNLLLELLDLLLQLQLLLHNLLHLNKNVIQFRTNFK